LRRTWRNLRRGPGAGTHLTVRGVEFRRSQRAPRFPRCGSSTGPDRRRRRGRRRREHQLQWLSNRTLTKGASDMSAGTRRRLRLLGRIMLFGTLIGVAYSLILQLTVYGVPLTGAMIGAIHGLLLSGTIGALEIFGGRTPPGRAVEPAPFLVTLG